MKASQFLVTTFVAFSTLTAAWPRLEDVYDLKPVEALEGYVFPRQDNDDEENSRTTARETEPAETSEPTITRDDTPTRTREPETTVTGESTETEDPEMTDRPPRTGTRTEEGTETGTRRGSRTGTRTFSRTKAINPLDPAGGVQLQTPGPLEGPQYYKVGDYITFGWNYTSLSATPSYIDVMATCTVNNALYTIAANQSFETSALFVWDTKPTPSPAYVVAMYTLLIYDSEAGTTAIPQAGYLSAFKQFSFGMYTPKPKVDWNDYHCIVCNAGVQSMERQTLTVLLGTTMVTVLSFTWFANGFGIF
ncbi:hypothetical protein M501DRAFT_994591 [Patellaria atrata CBS 101060]|uniref:DUF7137 domain-containing protein n=1 Tax=Patellaria atrata CBS 101060 TaxID=1346257 RepID=A0A9P4SKN0_9PEZI|nr:hypothetical protein M501DRAFT_994591 [Patellaria atrata CBS 101060]